jgi:hypothetical protein
MISQEDFNQFVQSYNADYLHLLTRAGSGSYDCLITSFTVLKDLHDVINKLHDATHLEFHVVPHPLTFRGSDPFLQSLGFDAGQIANIYGFLEHVRLTQGKEFEACIEDGVPHKCAVAGYRNGPA